MKLMSNDEFNSEESVEVYVPHVYSSLIVMSNDSVHNIADRQ